MSETDTNRMFISGAKLKEQLGEGETWRLPTKGFFRKSGTGKKKNGTTFKYNQFYIMGDENEGEDNNVTVSISVESAGGKNLVKQMEAFREQRPNDGELGHWKSDAVFERITQIRDRESGELIDTDFLSVHIDADSVKQYNERVFTPSNSMYNFSSSPKENTKEQLTSFK